MYAAKVILDDIIEQFAVNSADEQSIAFDCEKVSQFVEEKLSEIGQEKDFNVLFCAEKSSYVWGTSYCGSDNDIKAIIYYKQRCYYSPTKELCRSWKVQYRPSNQQDLDLDIDLHLMEFKKVCELILKNDPTILEIFSSPLQYVGGSEKVIERFKEIIYSLYDYRKVALKFLGMVRVNYLAETTKGRKRRMVEEKPLKYLFYIWRALLSAEWLLKHRQCKGLPLNINDLVHESDLMENEQKRMLLKLLRTKLKKAKFDIDCEDSKQLLIDADKILDKLWPEVSGNKRPKKFKNEEQVKVLEQFVFDVIESGI